MTSLYGNSARTGTMRGTNTGKMGGYNVGRINRFSPEQMELFQNMFSNVSPESYTGRLAAGDESLFGEMEAPSLRQFSALQGNLASRFSGMGAGARRSSGFQNVSNQAASELAQDLQSRRQDLQRQAIKDLMSMSSDILGQRPFEEFLMEPQKKKSFLQKILGGVLPIGGALIGGAFGGPSGAAIGGRIGSAGAQAFY